MIAMNVRIEEVANAAQVSTATVSRALNNLPGVGQQTREHVLKVALELGYSPSHSASALASGTSHSIGIVLPDVSRWFFATAVQSIEMALHERHYDALMYTLPYDEGKPRPTFNPTVLRSKVDAVAVLSVYFSEQEVELLKSLNLPVAFLSVRQPGFSHVGIDDEAAMRSACENLIAHGHRIIGHLSGMTNDTCPNAPTERRRRAWKAMLGRHGLECSDSLDSPARVMTAQHGYEAAKILLNRRPDVTAIVASSDEMAMGAIQCLRERSLTPGVDVAVIGIDGNNLSEAFGLTTVAQPVYEQSMALLTILLAALAGDTAHRELIFPTHLIARNSTARQHVDIAHALQGG